MIYTVTFNPAVDLVMQVPDFQVGTLNRSVQDSYVAGGKGINASFLLARLGRENIATGFIGGFSGQFITDQLEREGVQTHFIEIDEPTRINVKLKGDKETEINALGPTISSIHWQEIVDYLEQVLTSEDVLFLAGNAAPGLDEEAYIDLAEIAQKKQAKFVLDTNQELLKACLPYQPFIIKPNQFELGEIFGTKLSSEAEITQHARRLQHAGAQNVLVSLGGEGSLLFTPAGEVFRANAPKGKVINSVGAGDSMLAGFIDAYLKTGSHEEALKVGAACGSATAFSVGIAEVSLIEEVIQKIKIKKVEE